MLRALQLRDRALALADLAANAFKQTIVFRGDQCRFVALFHRQFKQIAGVTDALTGLVQGGDDVFQLRALLAQGLGPLGLVPDVRQGQFALYFDQSFALLVVVKDTPSAHRRARPGR